jgi:threonylcarbamoyladenosine tRNA methylthiotransferase MtaB
VQSGNDEVLAKMKRLYRRDEFLRFIENAAKKIPDVLLGTDMMVGFPGEDESAFRDSCDLMENSPLAYAHVFSFSERNGTAAQRLEEKISAAVKKHRSAELHRLSENKKREFYRRFVGRRLRVLVEECNEQGDSLGYSDNYLKVFIPQIGMPSNTLINIEAVGCEDHLIGRPADMLSIKAVTA